MTGSHKHRYQCSGSTLASTYVQHCIHHCIIVLIIQPVNFIFIRSSDVSREGLKFYLWTIFYFHYFFINPRSTALSTRALDGHQLYSRGSVVGKASTIGIEISPTSPLIFTGGQKVQNLASFSTSLKFQPPAFENAARYPNAETNFSCRNDRPMSSPSLVKLGLRTPKNRLSVVSHPLKLHGVKLLNRQ